MQIIWNINDYEAEGETVVTLGTFDGVHAGHRAILSQLREKAIRHRRTATMITFEPHPQLVVRKNDQPAVQILTTIEEKIRILERLGLERLIVAHFTPALAGMSPERFVKEILLQKLHMKEIVIGYDHAFGRSRSGNQELLQKIADNMGFTVTILEPVTKEANTVSSTKIRNLLMSGQVKAAAALLNRFYTLSGQVVRGDARGRQLGYPTLNIRPYSRYKLIPATGIYATMSGIDGNTYRSVTYIGERPTFSGRVKQVETHLVDFDDNVYGKEVDIRFIDFIRADKKFADKSSLVDQIKEDLRISRELLQKDAS